jgi:hypothetical protein
MSQTGQVLVQEDEACGILLKYAPVPGVPDAATPRHIAIKRTDSRGKFQLG